MILSTILEKVIKRKGRLRDGVAIVDVDKIMSHDNTTPLAIEAFERFEDKTLHADKIVIIFDHICPPSFIDAAANQNMIKDFCRAYGIQFFEGVGICHTLMIERGFAEPFSIVVGGDSHTPVYGVVGAIGLGMGSTDIAACWKTGKTWISAPETVNIKIEGQVPKGVYSKDIALKYVGELGASGSRDKAIEFNGTTLQRMDKYERMPIGLMATEVGAVTEVFWDEERKLVPDGDVAYADRLEVDVSELEPLIACPHKPANVKAVDEVEGRAVHQVFIGSCTNGTLGDLRETARVLRNRKVNPFTRTLVAPATLQVYNDALREGLVDAILESGAMLLMPPGCGPCLGRHFGVLSKGDVCVSTSNRNYRSRMGSPEAEIYLASPATAAATAIEGKITDPRRYL